MSVATSIARPAAVASAESALRAAFSEGTVVLAFLALACALLYAVFKLVLLIRERRRLTATAEFKQAEMKRLRELADATRAADEARTAAFRNPVYDNLHLAGTVNARDVMDGTAPREGRAPAPEQQAYVPARRSSARFLRAQSRLFMESRAQPPQVPLQPTRVPRA